MGVMENPTIIIRAQEYQVVIDAINALAIAPIFQRGGMLVHISREPMTPHGIERPPNAPRITPVPQPRLRELMTEYADWCTERMNKDGELIRKPAHPPSWAVQEIAVRGQWDGILPLEGIVEVPILRPDGTIFDTPGYDSATGLVHVPAGECGLIFQNPSLADAEAARDLLLDCFVDFPLESDIHRAAVLAMLLTPFARSAFTGPAPLGLVDSNVRGAGKGLLCSAIAMIYSGRNIALTPLPNTDEEMRKRITAIALAGDPIVLIDNVSSVLGFPSLDAALTATVWTDRILGVSATTPALPLRSTWLATGNNVALGADTTRRVLHMRLESREERPEERRTFKYPSRAGRLLEHIAETRPKLVAAALTILRGYCVAGRPNLNLKPWGSFEGWSDLVRSAVVWCGMPDPGETRRQLAEQADTEGNALKAFIDALDNADPRSTGMTASQMLQLAAAAGNDYVGLSEAIAELAPTQNGKPPSAKSLGKHLQHLRRRVVGERYIDKMPLETRNGVLWVVRKLESQKENGQ